MESESKLNLINEYLITVKQDLKKIDFIKYINQKLKDRGFVFDFEEFYITLVKSNGKNIRICKYELDKIYHKNPKTKHLFFVLKIYIVVDEEEENNKHFENLPDDIFRLKKVIEENLDRDGYIENIKKLKDEYNSYCLKKSYPIIFEIENSMRLLIYKTMTFLAKKDWERNEIPDTVKNQIKDDRKDLGIFGTDFSHLSKLLFERTEKSNTGALLSLIENLSECKEKDLDKLKNKVPKSNWQKYFYELQIKESLDEIKKDIYNDTSLSDTDTIEKILSDLNIMRNKIAHNNFFIEDDFYNQLLKKSSSIIGWIKNAIEYIEETTLQKSKERILNNLSDCENILYDKITDLNKKLSQYYSVKEKSLESYLKNNFFQYSFEEDKDICKYKCIKDVLFFMRLQKSISQELTSITKEECKKYDDDLDDIIKNIKNCPEAESESESTSESNTLSRRR